ncbi:hypothetical protein EW145_g2542 [Phellinidium pouzarii]|uniref:Uncharacterized protein n=1 Tax=Phellinidium pouzarii TaxID=167371 RepID=A0A4S4LAG1_9AGAM|nr:hypothetical protein EW145_g2542 [Phellinidium pouzarii]
MSEAPSSSSGSDTLVDDDYSELDLNIETESVYTLCSQQESASDLTVSDVPGAGRTLGHGPDAVAEQIARTTFRGTRVAGTDTKRAFSFVEWKVADGNEAKLHTCCQKLVCYTGSNEQLTRMRALEQTIQLVTAQPRFRPYFREPVIVGRLRDIIVTSSLETVAVDLESTERLLITVLLPRCRAMHTLDFNRVLYNPQSSCRCKRYGQAIQEMQPLLDLLRRPEARNIFQRATAIVDQLWESKDDDTLG